jgi:hypothetical protein
MAEVHFSMMFGSVSASFRLSSWLCFTGSLQGRFQHQKVMQNPSKVITIWF